jgi:hypothetical protein
MIALKSRGSLRIIFEKFYSYKLENLEEMDKFPYTYDLPKLKDIKNLNK